MIAAATDGSAASVVGRDLGTGRRGRTSPGATGGAPPALAPTGCRAGALSGTTSMTRRWNGLSRFGGRRMLLTTRTGLARSTARTRVAGDRRGPVALAPGHAAADRRSRPGAMRSRPARRSAAPVRSRPWWRSPPSGRSRLRSCVRLPFSPKRSPVASGNAAGDCRDERSRRAQGQHAARSSRPPPRRAARN